MNKTHKEIRDAIRGLPLNEAVRVVQAFHLLPEEEDLVIDCDVYRMSHVAAAQKYHVSLETVKRRRMSAYRRMALQIDT